MQVSDIIPLGGGVTAIARHFGVDHSAVIAWRKKNRVPAERVPMLSALTGVPRHEIRPDVYEAPGASA